MSKSTRNHNDPLRRWSVADALELYGVARWGRDYFGINEQGNLTVSHDQASVDMKVLVDDLVRRGIQPPLLIRFANLLESRIRLLNEAFAAAMADYEYRGGFRGVYPVKVNQSRKVVEAITRLGRPFHHGLEVGSKPELLAAIAMLDDPEALVICNGYKDEQYVATALLAAKLGRNVIVVVERPGELELVHHVSNDVGARPTIGVRLRPSARGAGKWEKSAGDHAKFGLSAAEILSLVDKLRQWQMLDCFALLHFHLGSQISSIRAIKDALREAARTYVELVAVGCDALRYFDVGGGLGVDYDGSQTNFDSSMNYTVQEYANDVVAAALEACDASGVEHPTVVTESGRAVVAHHSMLVANVIGVAKSAPKQTPPEPAEDAPTIAHNLWEVYSTVSRRNLRECFHDALEYKDQTLQLFNVGNLSLEQRADCERLFWATCHRMLEIARALNRVPREIEVLERMLSDTYFCNFSMFQSLPDAWAVDQIFPIMPVHRLAEKPTCHAVLADITCDSDGTLEAFIGQRDVTPTLPLHALNSEPYYLAMLLTGAYQEILGDLHNLFGDTNVVHVVLTGPGRYQIDEVTPGDTVTDVLQYVDYTPAVLINRLRGHIEQALDSGCMTLDESKQLMQRCQAVLASSTYLE